MRVAQKLRNLSIFLALLSFIYSISPSSAANDLKEDYDNLFLFVTVISVVVAVGVIGIWIYFMQKFSESNTEVDRTPISHEAARKLEVTWTLVTIGIVIILMIVSYPFLFDLDSASTDLEANETIRVNAVEWDWSFVRINSTGHEVTTKNLILAAGFNYEFEVTSVGGFGFIHSFFVPDLNIKIDALPGVINSITIHISETGIYQILCAEYCGAGHSQMRDRTITVV
ncbi:MAG: Cytochrome c oxidase subunit 2 precursor [Candidatus Heimdallarchaeota archaeon LC_2]|nr:MAG: Cytochrome c oxidase subunit 2 precursor [Candidatus Heimdallarchaeota archaeon LC_2]